MIRVVAYGTHKQAYFDLFMESCKRFNIEPVILGWGEPWVGFGKKCTDIRDYAKTLPKDDIILAVDPFDVIFLCDLDEIEEKFRQSGSKLIVGALKVGKIMQRVYNAEFNKTGKPTPKTKYGYDYVNSGTLITTAGYAVELFDRFVSEFGMTPVTMDQEIFTALHVHGTGEVDLDWKCEIFHNLLFTRLITRKPNLKDLKFDKNRFFNTSTGTYPCIIHASGNAFMDDLAIKLGYDPEKIKPVEGNINFLKKAFFHIVQLKKEIIAFLLILIILAAGAYFFLDYIMQL